MKILSHFQLVVGFLLLASRIFFLLSLTLGKLPRGDDTMGGLILKP